METIEHYDGIFFISSCLQTKLFNIYPIEERFQHTIQTVESINKYCPKNLKIMHDASIEMPDPAYFDLLGKMGVTIVYTGQNPNMQELARLSLKSASEMFSTIIAVNWFNENVRPHVSALRAYKISGRYKLNDNFILHDERFKDAFVHNMTVDSYMPQERREATGAYKAYGSRLIHWDYNLMDAFIDALPKMFNDCIKYGIDAEHAYCKHFQGYKNVDLPKVGVEGWIAPLGKYEDD